MFDSSITQQGKVMGENKIDVSKGIGTVMLDGENVEEDRKYGNGENYLDIDGGIGDININFEK